MSDMSDVYEKRGPLNGKMMPGRKVISFSLWGDKPDNCIGAIDNARKASKYFPDWICRFYVSTTVPSLIVETLKNEKNTEVIIINQKKDVLCELWKLFATEDQTVDVCIFRSVSSRLTKRDSIAVEDWLRSSYRLHIIRDHPFNNPHPIPVNSWGVICNDFRWLGNDSREYIKNFIPTTQDRILNSGDEKEVNERTLIDYLNKIYVNHITQTFIHDSFPHFNPWSCRNFEQGKIKEFSTGIPVERNIYQDHTNKWDDFIGQEYDQENNPNVELREALRESEEKLSEMNKGILQTQGEWI